MKTLADSIHANRHGITTGRAIRVKNDEGIGLENQVALFGFRIFQGSPRPDGIGAIGVRGEFPAAKLRCDATPPFR